MTDVPRVRVTRVGDHRVTAVTLVGVPGTTAVTDFATLPEVIGGQRGDVVVSPSTLNNSRAERDIRSFTTVQAALSSGLAIVVPKGVTISTTATLTIPSNLQLVIDGRMQRTFNGGAMFSTTGTATGVRISGTGSVGAQSLTVGTGPIFTGTYNDSTIEGIAVDTYAAGAAWSVSGTRLRLDQVKVFNAAATSATTGIAILTGDQVVVGGCYIVAGGDGMQISANRATIADNQIPTVPLGAYGINLLAGSGIVVRDNVIASSASAAAALRAASIVVLPRFQDNDVSGIVGSPIQIELGCLAYVYDNRGVPAVVPVTAANYTVGALDDRRLIEVNSAISRTITFLLDAKNSLPIGEFLGVSNIGTANVQLAAEAGVALRGATTVIPANGFAHVHKTAANTYFIDLGTVGGGGGGASNAEVWVGPGTPVDITPVTTTQLWVDTDDPGAIGGGGGGTVSDATTTAKGIVQLAGDLAGTADAPRVPALLTKSDATHTHTSGAGAAATTTTPGIITLAGDLAGTSAAPTVPGLALKADLTHTHGTSGSGVGEVAFDSFTAANDDARLAAAFSFAGAQTYPPTIAFTNRLNGPFPTTRVSYPGLRLKGPPGYSNAEKGDNLNGCRIQLTMNGPWLTTSTVDTFGPSLMQLSFIGSGTNASVIGNTGAGTYYCTMIRDVSSSGLRSFAGSAATKILLTAAQFDGFWEINNCYGTAFHMGISDCTLWPAGMLIDSGVPFNVAGGATGLPHLWFDHCEKSYIGPIYMTTEGPWGGILIDGVGYNASTSNNQGGPLIFSGLKVEGRNAGQPCDGALVRQRGGMSDFSGCWLSYAMESPATQGHSPTDSAVIDVQGGHCSIERCYYDRANGVAESVLFARASGSARLDVGKMRVAAKGGIWTDPRPRVSATTPGNLTTDSTVLVV